jgi:hypothetical protein
MTDQIALIAMAFASLAIIYRAIGDFLGAKSRELMLDFTNGLGTYALSFALIFITILIYNVLTGNIGDANIIEIVATFAMYCLIAYIFYLMTPSLKSSKTAFLLYLFSLAIQVWYAFGTKNPPAVLLIIGVFYYIGASLLSRIGGMLGWILRIIFPKTDELHAAWFDGMKKGEQSTEISDKVMQAHIRSGVAGFPRSSKFEYLGSNVAGTLCAYALWNLMAFIAVSLLFG